MVSGSSAGDGVVDLLSIGHHIWRLKWKIVMGSVLFSACAWALSWVLPRDYEAISVVRILSEEYVRVEPYEQFAKSDAIFQHLVSHLKARNLIEDETSLGPRSILLGVSREVPSGYLPALSFSVKAKTPELAQAAANAWAALVVDEQASQAAPPLPPPSVHGVRLKAATALEVAERQLLQVKETNAQEIMAARQRHEVTTTRAELAQRQRRIIAAEEELLEVRRLKLASPVAQLANLESRESALAAVLERNRSEASRLGRDLDAADMQLSTLARRYELHEKQLERVVSEAADRYRQAAEQEHVLPSRWVKLELGSRAPLPPGPSERSRRVAIVAIPFGIFVSFFLAFLAALAKERRSASC